MPFPFEFALEGPPVSQQARRQSRRRSWIQEIQEAAKRAWGDQAAVEDAITVNIVYIYDRVPLDVDNIPKPILDALKGLVFSDDGQVTDLICRKRPSGGPHRIALQSLLFNRFIRDKREFVYVRVSLSTESGEPL